MLLFSIALTPPPLSAQNGVFGGSVNRGATPSLPPVGHPIRHDSYQEAIDSDCLSLDSAGITFTAGSQGQSGREVGGGGGGGVRGGGKREGGGTVSGKERGGKGGRGGKRWMFQRANSFSLPAVHEEHALSKGRRQELSTETIRCRERSPAGAAGLARGREGSPGKAAGLARGREGSPAGAGSARGSITRINSNSSHSIV